MDSSDSDASILTKTFKCIIVGCNASFSKNSKLIVHIRKHTGERPFVCDEPNCTKTYTNNSHLRRHKKVSHGVKTTQIVLCEHEGCGAMLANKYSLKKHYNCKHNPQQYQFKCNECSQGFHRKKQLQQHMYLHTGEAAFSCDKCDMNFTTTYNLNKHKRSHRTYRCDCGETFHRWTLILAHKKVCKRTRFKCEVCFKTFSHLGNFRSHKLVHMPKSEKLVLICPYKECERFYFYKKNLKHHIDSFHKKVDIYQTFKCTYPKCKTVLKTKQSLKIHLQRHFQWTKKKIRQIRHDRGKSKKSILSVLIGEQPQSECCLPGHSENSSESHTVERISSSDHAADLQDPLLKQCDLVLKMLNEEIIATN